MIQNAPEQYFVIRSPYAQCILAGVKTFEFRSFPKMFSNKRLAIAVAKSFCDDEDLEGQFLYWEKQLKKSLKKSSKKESNAALEKFWKCCKKAERLLNKTNGCGMIIGEVVTGDVSVFDRKSGIPILRFKLWPEAKWKKSPGGLGVRYMPGAKRKSR